jgi:hypothetical protein
MTAYHGIVKDNVVLLPEEVHLQDGTEVEVTIIPTTVNGQISPQTLEAAEEASKQRLLEKGLPTEIKRPSRTEPKGDRTPIKVKGNPMSQMVIEDRR